jgi:hypothetical protein
MREQHVAEVVSIECAEDDGPRLRQGKSVRQLASFQTMPPSRKTRPRNALILAGQASLTHCGTRGKMKIEPTPIAAASLMAGNAERDASSEEASDDAIASSTSDRTMSCWFPLAFQVSRCHETHRKAAERARNDDPRRA